MSVNIELIGSWDPNSEVISDQEFDNNSKIYYPSTMCFLKPEPPIVPSLNATACESYPCDCIETNTLVLGSEEGQCLKFEHHTAETRRHPSPVQVLMREPDKFKTEEERPFRCNRLGCNKTFLLKHHLRTHEKTHTGERPHACVHCGKTFTHKYCLNTHLLLHTNERPHQCTECNKRFTLKHHLMSHVNVHKRERPFLCSECGKSFPLKKQLITHEKFHRGERPFVCEECGDTFGQENHLVMHLRFHGSLSSFVCQECGATFTRKFELDNHERLHGKEPLLCTICNKEFLQRRSLLAHLKIHENKKSCRICGEQFPNLNSPDHQQTLVHFCKGTNQLVISKTTSKMVKMRPKVVAKSNKNKKYFCDVCFRKFSAKHGLTQHKKRQHNIGGNLFSCHICCKSFREKQDLLLHKHVS